MDLPTKKELAGAGVLTPGVLPHTFRIPVLPSTGVYIIQNTMVVGEGKKLLPRKKRKKEEIRKK